MSGKISEEEKYNLWKNNYTLYASYYLIPHGTRKSYSLEYIQKKIKKIFSISDIEARKKLSLSLSDNIVFKMLSYDSKHVKKTIIDCMNIAYKKNKDYGSANILDFGISGLLVRINDKIARLINLQKIKSRSVKDETIEDTIKDIINYSIYIQMLAEDAWF